MPRREYPKKEGKFGTIYKVARGITVRRDNRQQWSLEIARKGQRKSVTMGTGPEGRAKAIEAAEGVAKRIRNSSSSPRVSKGLKMDTFLECARRWHSETRIKWTPETEQRYEDLIRLPRLLQYPPRSPS